MHTEMFDELLQAHKGMRVNGGTGILRNCVRGNAAG